MEYLQQVPDSLSMDHTYSLLQEMELMGEDEEDEDIVNDVAEEEDLEIENNEEVIFSPQTHKTLTIDFVKVNLILAKQKWGPVQAMRKSARVDVGDRTMLEIAVNTKKVQNLETNKKEIKGTIVKTSFEHFTDPKFIAVASKIGVEIDKNHHLSAG